MILDAIDTATGLVLSQLPIQNKECEVTQIPELLKLLDIRGSTITMDAAGTQTFIMAQIIDQGGHFVMMVKKNQPTSYEEIKEQFGELEEDRKKLKTEAGYQPRYPELMEKYDVASYFEKNRDRYEYRSYRVCNAPECVTKTKKEWPFIKSVGYVSQTRILMVRDENGGDIRRQRER